MPANQSFKENSPFAFFMFKKLCFSSLLIFLLSFLLFQTIHAQNENRYWYFGQNAGIHFSPVGVEILLDGALDNWEGCTSISSSLGALLFYTDGTIVRNRIHQGMPNGTDLLGDESSTQTAIVIPHPDSSQYYYLFTMDDVDGSGGVNGLNYSKIDMTLKDGLGDVVESEKNIELESPVCEKLAAVKHANGTDVWVLIHKWGTNEFHAYLVTGEGVSSTPVVSYRGEVIGGSNIDVAKGYMKFSPDGNKLAKANAGLKSVEVFDFNSASGRLYNAMLIPDLGGEPYGIEFSPSNQFLYVNTWKSNPWKYLYQFDLFAGNAGDIINSKIEIATGLAGGLQLVPDGKIYIANSQTGGLSRINYPNKEGAYCHFEYNVVDLEGRQCMWGLPNFIAFGNDTTVGIARYDKPKATEINIFPNPAVNSIVLEYKLGQEIKNAVVEILSFDGMLNNTYSLDKQSGTTTINISELQSGIYLLRIKGNNKTSESEKFIKY